MADNGAAFISAAVSTVYANHGIKGKHSTPYNPQSNGIVERAIQTLKRALGKYLQNDEYAVAKFLPQVVAAYNATTHSSTGYSPFYMMFHRHPRSPLQTVLISANPMDINEATANRLQAELKARDKIAKFELQQDKYLVKHQLADRDFTIGDRAYIFDESASRTFQPRYKELVTIIGKLQPNVYVVERANGKVEKVNIRRLLKYLEPTSPFQVDVSTSQVSTPSTLEPPTTTSPPSTLPEPTYASITIRQQPTQDPPSQPASQREEQYPPQQLPPQEPQPKLLNLSDFEDKLPGKYFRCLQLAHGFVDKLNPGAKVRSNHPSVIHFKSTIEGMLGKDPLFQPIKHLATTALPNSATPYQDRKQEILRQAETLVERLRLLQ